MFNENPISNDYNVQQEIYRYKQARYLKNKKNKELNLGNNFSYNNQILQKILNTLATSFTSLFFFFA